MSLIRSKNTKPEIALRKLISAAFYPRGYRYRIHYKKALGCPDIAFVAKKVAVFVDGAFWHGYRFRKNSRKLPKKYWLPKIQANMRRDRKVNSILRKRGWKVVRFWDHDMRKNPVEIVKAVAVALKVRHHSPEASRRTR